MKLVNLRLLKSPFNWAFVAIVFAFVMMTLHHFSTANMESN